MTGKRASPHKNDPTYAKRAAAVRAAAKRNPDTRCWRCGRTLAEHAPHKSGRAAWWTAGHVNDGEVGGELRAEASTCNYSAGASYGNAQRTRTEPPPAVNRGLGYYPANEQVDRPWVKWIKGNPVVKLW
ncbi:MAG: hypothetical protein R2715_15080 [Ilumatobacteraceae bacterium]